MHPTDLGILSACLAHGISPADLPLLKGASDAAADDPRAGAVGQLLARAVRDLFVNAGKRASVACQLYDRLAQEPVWEDAHWNLLDPALRVISAHREARMEKVALGLGTVATAARGAAGKVTGAVPSMGNLLVWLALAGGGALGGSAYALRRGASDDETTVAMEDKIKHYNNVASEIEDELGQEYPSTRSANRPR